MAKIHWTQSLETGIPFVDADHRMLVGLLNQVEEGISAAEETALLASVLNALNDYTVYHFAREEAMLLACGYAGFEEHRRIHGNIAGRVAEITRKFRQDSASVEKNEVRDFLHRWLVEHIRTEDFAYLEQCRTMTGAVANAESIHFADSIGVRNPDFARMRVQVVEDNPRFRKFLVSVLKAFGVKDVSLAASGAEAIDRWNQRPGNRVICDWVMDGMPAHAFAAAIRAVSPQTRIVALSGLAADQIWNQAGSGTLDAVLEKPISPAALAHALVGA
ncbi:MAG: bacteriohemerythrin [Alphaproteobacteria bacterium]|nr:bacteriohemerythrin [Alphaproteobacteria bacterium]MBM3949921.1 bacteriohemerythrin [Rhodospirillales bacterium]